MIDFKLTGNQIIIMHMFPNISRSSGNQTMKFGWLIELIELSMRNIFLEKLNTKCGGEARSRTFMKSQN